MRFSLNSLTRESRPQPLKAGLLCARPESPCQSPALHPPSHPGALTDNAPQCVHPHSPSATCPPQPTGAGRPSWSQVCPGKQTSAGTGSAVPAGDPPAAGGTAVRQRNMSMNEPWPPPRLSPLGSPGYSPEKCSAPGTLGPPNPHLLCQTQTPPP